MAYRRKGSGKPSSSEAPSHSDEPSSPQSTDPEPLRTRGTASETEGNASSRTPSRKCSVCGKRTFLFALPGQSEKYCFECSADVATTHLLATEIDAATMAGQDANALITEFELLSCRLLARAQSA